ncbi:MAG: nuclear transport factor 2 family protein [Polyangiaceae bacterium]
MRMLGGSPLATLSLLALSACLACSGEDSSPAAGPTPTASASNTPPPPASTSSGNPAAPAPGTAETPNDGLAMAGGGAIDPGTSSAGSDDGTTPDPGPALPALACERSVTEANKATVSAAIDELFVQGDITAVDRYWGEPYLQHNPIAASGVTTFRNLFAGLISPGNSIYSLSRIVAECELVLIHGDYTSFGGPTFDMFRVVDGRIVEHWDAAATGAGPNGSGHTALDGATGVEDVELTRQNEALVLRFVDEVLIGGARAALGNYLSPTLVEHDPQSSDGADAYGANLQARQVTYRAVRREIADGNFVFVLSEGAVGNTDVAHYDLFRVEGDRIVEHWNGRRDVPATTQSGLGIF